MTLISEQQPHHPAVPKPLCQICTPVGMLGYGFDEELLRANLEHMTATGIPTAVILDSGSTDSGPSKLALGTKTVPDASYKKDLIRLVKAVLEFNVRLLISSVGGSGSNEHVDEFLQIIQDVVAELKSFRALKIIAVWSGISKAIVLDRLAQGQISGCGKAVPELTPATVEQTARIVGQAGPGPLLDAVAVHPDFDILIAGRAYDPAPYVAYCISQRTDALGSSPLSEQDVPAGVLGGFYHMGKIMECGGLCATPKSYGAKATIYEDGTFDVAPMDAVVARCTPLSVAAHTLYEKTRPDLLHGPGGYLDLRQTTYEALHDESNGVRVRGGHFTLTDSPEEPSTLKLEGARMTGYRTLFMGSFRDPILIAQVDEFLAAGTQRIRSQFPSGDNEWSLEYHVYGRSAKTPTPPEEVFVVGEVLAPTQMLASSIASSARIHCVHGSYKGQLATGGNFAFGIGGQMEIEAGPCCEFSVYHLINLTPSERKGISISDTVDKIASKENAADGLFRWQASIIPPTASKAPDSYYASPVNRTFTVPKGSNTKTLENGTSAPQLKDIHTLRDIAKVIRSKNAGPYEITFDVMFDNDAIYQAVKLSGILAAETMASLFGRSVKEVVWCGFFDKALAFKVTFPRFRGNNLACSGGYMENDVHGAQQYVPLLQLPLTSDLISELQSITA